MKFQGVIHLLIPTHELITELEMANMQLAKVGVTVKESVEMFVSTWNQYNFNDGYSAPYFEMNEESHAEMAKVQARLLTADIIFDAFERSREQGQPVLSADDRKEIEKIMMLIWHQVVGYIYDLLEQMGVETEQRDQLKFVRWAGSDIIVSIPVPSRRNK